MKDMLLNRQRCDKIWCQINLLSDNIGRPDTEPHFQQRGHEWTEENLSKITREPSSKEELIITSSLDAYSSGLLFQCQKYADTLYDD